MTREGLRSRAREKLKDTEEEFSEKMKGLIEDVKKKTAEEKDEETPQEKTRPKNHTNEPKEKLPQGKEKPEPKEKDEKYSREMDRLISDVKKKSKDSEGGKEDGAGSERERLAREEGEKEEREERAKKARASRK